MMKKMMIGVIALLLVLTGCSSTYVLTTEQEVKSALESGINLLDNPGFESGTAENWGFSDSVFINPYDSHSGEYSAVVNPVGGTEYFFNVVTADCDLDGAVVLSAWIRLSSAWDADAVSFVFERQLKGGRNDNHKVIPDRTSDWQQVVIEAPGLPDGSVQNLVVKVEVNGARGSVLFDDFQVVSLNSETVNYLRNGSFSDYGSNWGNYTHSYGRDGNGAVLDFSVPTVGLVQSTQWWSRTSPVYNPNADMVFSAYVSPASGSYGVVRLRVERKPESGSVYRDFTVKPGSGWQRLELPLEGTSTEIDEAIFNIEVLNGEGELFIDDVGLHVVNLQAMASQESSAVSILSSSEIIGSFLTNGTLESGDGKVAANWGLAPGWDQVPRSYWTNREAAHSGKGSVLIQQYEGKEQVLLQANGWQDRSTTETYDPTKPMLFSAYVKLNDVSGDGVYLRVERKYDANGAEQVLLSSSERVTGTTDGWVRLEAFVEPSDQVFKEYLWDVVVSPGTGSLYVDDLDFVHADDSSALVASPADVGPVPGQNVLRNPGMEELNAEGGTLHWDVWPGNPAEGVRDSELVGGIDGGQALKINLVFGNPQAVYQYCVADTVGKFDFNQEYTFSCQLKLDDVMVLDGKGVTIGIKRRGVDGQEYNVYQRIEESSCDWTRFEVTAEKAPVDIVQYDVIIDIGSGMGAISIDDCALVLAKPKPEVEELVLAWE